MAHGERDEHEATIRAVRDVDKRFGPLGILVDLAGPKLRLGSLFEDPVVCEKGTEVRFIRGIESTSRFDFVSNYEELVDFIEVGERIMLADGTVGFIATAKSRDAVTCRVLEGGELRSRQGINVTGSNPGLPALTDYDRECVRWAVTQDVDFLSLSFVQASVDVLELKNLLHELHSDLPVIAKIEKRQAIGGLAAIAEAADGIMVARGDLGVEIDVAEIPVAQKQIVSMCNQLQKPVIVATEMLDSMRNASRPTRAEATDVANAILDGADACMLSGETAIGAYPVEAVSTMNRIMLTTEELLRDRPSRDPAHRVTTGAQPITSAVVYGAGRIADHLSAKLVVITTRSGATALTKSNLRDFVPTIGVSPDPKVLRRMTLLWGICPLRDAPTGNIETLRSFIFDWGTAAGILQPGDAVVFVAGRDTGEMAHNSISVHTV